MQCVYWAASFEDHVVIKNSDLLWAYWAACRLSAWVALSKQMSCEKYLYGPGTSRGCTSGQSCKYIMYEIICLWWVPYIIYLHNWSRSTATWCFGPCKYFSMACCLLGNVILNLLNVCIRCWNKIEFGPKKKKEIKLTNVLVYVSISLF